MSFRYRDERSTGASIATVLLGAVAGFAVGMFVAQRVGGFDGLTRKLRGIRSADDTGRRYHRAPDEYDEIEDDAGLYESEAVYGGEDDHEVAMGDDGTPLLEERVLEAFNNDPIMAERAVDIGALSDGTIELAGWVESDEEAEHAVTLARGVPGVETVVNRLMIDEEERQLSDNRRRRKAGDPALTEARWEGQQVGTGRRRQGTSDEMDRHADPKPELEDRWLSEREAIRNAADDIEPNSAERPRRGTRTRSGAPKPEEQPEA
jgi:hypothetical protein